MQKKKQKNVRGPQKKDTWKTREKVGEKQKNGPHLGTNHCTLVPLVPK